MAFAASCGSVKRDFPSVVTGGFRKESSCRRSSKIRCTLTDEYRTLRIQPGASETEVKKAFRSLALQYHPDVCKGNNCGVQFHQINEAYDALITSLRARNSSSSSLQDEEKYEYVDEEDLWEEWMGWEGAGIRDYTSHINPYI